MRVSRLQSRAHAPSSQDTSLALAPRPLCWPALDGAARISLSRAPRTSAPPFALHYIRSVWLSQRSSYLPFDTVSHPAGRASSQQPVIFFSHFIRPLLSPNTVLAPNSLQFSF